MKLDLNNLEEFTLTGVRRLLASKDDSTHSLIVVSKDGSAYLEDLWEFHKQDDEPVAMYYPSFAAGNGYVGEGAAADDQWVEEVFRTLDTHWAKYYPDYVSQWFAVLPHEIAVMMSKERSFL